MNASALRVLIEAAQQQEAQTPSLMRHIEVQLAKLHPALYVEGGNAPQVLVGLVAAYIDQTPELLEATEQVARASGTEQSIQPVLNIAADFFLEPAAGHAGFSGLLGLLDKTYLAHRLIEEINDSYIHQLGCPLIPVDSTRSNLIVHQLLGEAFANQLDQAVQRVVEQLLKNDLLNTDLGRDGQYLHYVDRADAWQQPCLAKQLGVGVQLTARQYEAS